MNGNNFERTTKQEMRMEQNCDYAEELAGSDGRRATM
jgi:hypothetical protein